QVDNMRELLESALYAPSSGRFKVYIIDEVHMLSKSAFNAMLKTLEEPPAHVKFILATTDPQKIPVTVLSRCLQFNLKQLPPALILAQLQFVLGQEGISYETGALNLIARAAQGSMRDALSLLDQAIAYSSGKVEESLVRTMLGAIDRGFLFDLLVSLRTRDGAGLLRIADDMALRSLSFGAALQDLATLLHRIALAQTIPQALAEDEPERARLLGLAEQFTAEEIQLNYQITIHGRNEIDLAPDEYAGFTMTLLRMLAFAPQNATTSVPKPKVSSALPTTKVTLSTSIEPIAVEPKPLVPEAKLALAQEPVNTVNLDWTVLLSQLNLQGMARELTKNSVLASFSENRVVLNLSPQYKHLQNNKIAHDKVQAALSEYFVKPVKLTIQLGAASDVATPAAVEQSEKQMRQLQAEVAVRQDPFVCDAQTLLGAQVIESLIKPV
ncbi:MAG: DNA polymerase III subunit gamma/tau, partial [Pseudomonadota bacterium]